MDLSRRSFGLLRAVRRLPPPAGNRGLAEDTEEVNMPLLPKLLVLCEDAETRNALEQSLVQCPIERIYCANTLVLREAVAAHAGDAVVYAEDRPGSKLREMMDWSEIKEGRVPVIAVSRFGGMRDYLAAMEAGAFDYLARPLRKEEVSRVVESALQRSRAAAA
jgi:DNA-binding NtrC family response regulator